MRRVVPVVVMLALSLAVVAGGVLYGQVKKDAKSGLDRIEGTIQSMNKDKSTIAVKQSGATGSVWKVAYTGQTKFTMRNKPAKVEDLKDGVRVIVLGKYEKDTLAAVRIDIRSAR